MVRRGLMFANRYPAATVLTVVGLVLGIVVTADMSTTYDSVRYANVGHCIAAGAGISTSVVTVPLQEGTRPAGDGRFAFTIQPPGLPIFYAATGATRWRTSHRVLHVLCSAALALLVFLLARDVLGRDGPALLASLAVLLSPVTMTITARYWSDLPFIVFFLGSLWAVVRAGRSEHHEWRWLLGASALAALATGFRLPGLALGLVFLADGIRGVRRRGPVHGLLRLLALGSMVVPVAVAIFSRNLALSGSLRGIAPQEWVFPPEPSLARAWTFLSSRVLELFVPGFATGAAAGRVEAVGEAPGAWWPVGVVVALLLLAVVAVLGVRRRGPESWYAVLLVAGYLAVLVLPAANHPQIRVVEQRLVAPILPLLWLPLAALLCAGGKRTLCAVTGSVVVAAFVVGAFFLPEPGGRKVEPLRPGLAWIAETIPADAPVLTNAGKELAEIDPSRRIYHISDWNFRAVLPEEMRSERSLRRWARERGITHFVFVGRSHGHQPAYWGETITNLRQGRYWPDQLAYRDRQMRVYRVPAPGERTRHTKGGALR